MNKKWPYVLVLIVVVFLAFFMYRKYKVAPTLKLEELSLVDLQNVPVKLSALKGKGTVLCFSASWCVNCREELETLSSLGNELKDIQVVVISDEPLEKVKRFKEKKGYPFTFLKLQQPFSAINIYSIPTTYILSKDLEIKKETVGYIHWNDPSTLAHIKKLMD